jgi:hypothetical protein
VVSQGMIGPISIGGYSREEELSTFCLASSDATPPAKPLSNRMSSMSDYKAPQRSRPCDIPLPSDGQSGKNGITSCLPTIHELVAFV